MAWPSCGPPASRSCGCGPSPIESIRFFTKETSMKLRNVVLTAAAVAAAATSVLSTSAFAQAKEQFIPVLSYRTGPYAPNGTPWANGYVDYIKLVNARGGLNGVKLAW